MLKNLDLYLYFSPKWVNIERTLMKLSTCFFLTKDGNLLENYNEIWEEVKNNLKKRIVSQYII